MRRDLADFFSTLVEGVKGKRAVEWRLVDAVYPTSQFKDAVQKRARELAVDVGPAGERPGHRAEPAQPDRHRVVAEVLGGDADHQPRQADGGPHRAGARPARSRRRRTRSCKAGDQFWALRAFRELDDALLRLRVNEPEIGTIVVRTEGDGAAVLAIDQTLLAHQSHWLVREIIHFMKRTLKRVDLTSRTFFAFIEPGSAFAGSLFELALAADRSYMFHDDNEENVDRAVADELRAADDEQRADAAADALPRRCRQDRGARGARPRRSTRRTPKRPAWSPSRPTRSTGTTKCGMAVEARAAFSPDAMTGLEANLRFAGPETMETKIFGRLTAWQNWIFQRPNAVGEKGALQSYGEQGRPEFDWNART